ncbi:hypothetical protein LEMLEM_LOCUS25533, partial [Lemmus lemmus]
FTLRNNVRRSCIREINLAGCLRWIGGEETRVMKASGRLLKQSRQGNKGLHKDAGSRNGKGLSGHVLERRTHRDEANHSLTERKNSPHPVEPPNDED